MNNKNDPKSKTQQQPSVSNNRNNLEQSTSTSVNVDNSGSVDVLYTYMNQTTISSYNNTHENHNITNDIPAVIHDQNYVRLTIEFVQFIHAPQPCERPIITALQNDMGNFGNYNYVIIQDGIFQDRSYFNTSISEFIENRSAITNYSSGPVYFPPRHYNEFELPDREQEMNNNVEPPHFYWRRNSSYPWNEHVYYCLVTGCMYFYTSTSLPIQIIIFSNSFFGESINSQEIPIGYCNCGRCTPFQ